MAGNGKTRSFAGAGHSMSGAGVRLRGGLFRRSLGDGDWQALSAGLPENVEARAIAVHLQNPDDVYVALEVSGVIRSADLGRTWGRIDRGVKADSTMMAVCVHPRDPAQVYCVARGGQVFGTADSGTSRQEYRLPAGAEDAYAIACV